MVFYASENACFDRPEYLVLVHNYYFFFFFFGGGGESREEIECLLRSS